MTAHTVAEAWASDCQQRGVSRSTPGHDDAQNLFYAGASAMLAMLAEAGRDGVHARAMILLAELHEYLDSLDA